MTTIKILIVEDESITAMDIQTRLQDLGYSVCGIASTGAEAIALSELHQPDIILMDIVLKGKMDGIAASQRISQRHNIPIIFLTAYNDAVTFNRAKQCTPYAYLNKPFELRDLHNAIELSLFKHAKDMELYAKSLQDKNTILEQASIEKDRFLASMSHELRTPLNAIIGFTGTLLMKLPGPLNNDQEEQLTTIQRSAKHLLSLINDLLNIAKITSGKMETHPVKIDCSAVIKDTIATVLPLAQAKGLELKIEVPSQQVTINSDRRILTQIILNLVSNAIKFTDKGGVTIQLENDVIGSNHSVLIHVIDTGIGIKFADQSKLFHPFEQIPTTGRRSEGTGLGLHLSQKMAHLLNGKIELTSEPGRGSQFTLMLSDIKTELSN